VAGQNEEGEGDITVAHYECRYCDSPFGSKKVGDDLVCSNCGAEWASSKMLIDDDGNEVGKDANH
jgi:uncharacterized Zn ribbon protein